MTDNVEVLLKVILKKINNIENSNSTNEQLVKYLKEYNQTIFHRFDATEYIKQPLEDFKKVYKYKGVLYELKELYSVLKQDGLLDVERAWFLRHAVKQEVDYFWGLRVNIVYLAKLNFNNGREYYISTDGKFYKGTLEEIGAFGPYNNAVRIMDNDEYVVMYAGEYVMFKFIDPDYPNNKVFFLDGDFSNCRIDNIDKMT